jgi:Ribonuclease G/E
MSEEKKAALRTVYKDGGRELKINPSEASVAAAIKGGWRTTKEKAAETAAKTEAAKK